MCSVMRWQASTSTGGALAWLAMWGCQQCLQPRAGPVCWAPGSLRSCFPFLMRRVPSWCTYTSIFDTLLTVSVNREMCRVSQMEVRRGRADLVRNLKPYAMSDVIVYPRTCRRQKSRWSRFVTFRMLLLRKCSRPVLVSLKSEMLGHYLSLEPARRLSIKCLVVFGIQDQGGKKKD